MLNGEQPWSGPNLNSLCVWHSNASPLSKSHAKFVWSEKLQKHIWTGVPSWAFALLKLWSAHFIPVNITIIFYSFLLVWITLLSWHIIMQTLKLFTVNGYYISHWKIKHMFFSTSSEHFHKIHNQASVAVLQTVNSAAILNRCSATCDFQNIGLDTLTNTCD